MSDKEQDKSTSSDTSPEGKDSVDKKSSGGSVGKRAAGAVVGNTQTGQKVQETVEKVNRARKIGQGVVKGVKSVAPILVNPYTWLVLAVVVIILWLIATAISAQNVIGRNENVDGCIPAESGGSGVAVVASVDATENFNSIATWLMSTSFDALGGKPMTLNQAAGVIGNWFQESKGDPAITQGGWGSADMSNREMMRVTGSGKAIGLAQWDGARRANLAKFAEQQGGHWSDMQIQLEFFRKELSEPYESNLLKTKGFTKDNQTVEHYVTSFEQAYERAGKPHYEGRFAGAKTFLDNFNGGYTSDTGGGCVTALSGAGSGEYSGEIAELAASLSYPKGSGNIVPPTPEYRAAKAKAEAETGSDPSNLYASCDRFVATVLRLTVDPDVPWGATAQQHQYFEASPKWERYNDASQRQPGDVWIVGGSGGSGHVIIHVDDNTIAHASLGQRSGLLTPLEGYFHGMRDNSGRPAYDGYRFVG